MRHCRLVVNRSKGEGGTTIRGSRHLAFGSRQSAIGSRQSVGSRQSALEGPCQLNFCMDGRICDLGGPTRRAAELKVGRHNSDPFHAVFTRIMRKAIFLSIVGEVVVRVAF